MRKAIGSATLMMLFAFAAAPSSAEDPSLLETWIWFELGGKIEMANIKQDENGAVELKKGSYGTTANIEETITYTVADRRSCIIQQSIPSLSSSTLIYLNSFLPGIQVLGTDNGAIEFAIMGKEHTHCTTEARGTFCMDQMHFRASDDQTFARMKQALNLMFSTFDRATNGTHEGD
jgi:hypothetical protein